MGWNHSVHYHPFVLASVPKNCVHALDVGCGRGKFTSRLASVCDRVTGIDSEPTCLPSSRVPQNVVFIAGDVMTAPLAGVSFDLVTVVSTLHHLPLDAALQRFRWLLKPGGTLAVVGHYRATTLSDHAMAAIARPVSRTIRIVRGTERVGAPTCEPIETLSEIRKVAARALPGVKIQRRLFFRYTLLWRKPAAI